LRAFDYAVGANYIYTPRSTEPIGFAELRALAQNHDITRLCIETRKDQIEALEWQIKPIDTDEEPAGDVKDREDPLGERTVVVSAFGADREQLLTAARQQHRVAREQSGIIRRPLRGTEE
jgi:hypothetical protein